MIFSTILVLWVVGMWLLSTTYITDTARKEIFQDVNYDTKDEYHLLTLAMAKGQTNLDGLYKEPERINQEKTELAALKKMENPYMFGKRANMKYKWDVAYYNNHYYTYYGPVPVVLVFLPFYLLTGSMLGTRFFTLIVAAIIAWLMCRLVLKITEQRKELNAWTVIGLLLGFLAVTQIPSCFRQASFYELSPMMSVMFGLGGINIFYSQSKKKKQSIFKIIIGALSMALAVGCKASGIMYSIVVVPFMIKMLYNNGSYHWGKNKIKDFIVKIFNKDNIKLLVAIIAPYTVVGVLLMIYNAVRFGSPFDFGINYQLTVYYVKYYSIKAVGKLPSVVFSGLLQLPRFTAEFPFVHPSTEHTQYMGNLFTFKGWIGAFCYPLTWVLVMLPWSLKRGIKAMKDKAFVITSFATGLFILYMIITVGGISLRYTIEALFLLFIPIIYIVMDLDEACARLKITKYFVYIWMALVFVALFMCVGLLLSGEWNNSFSEKPEMFYNLWKSFTFWR